MASEAAPSTDEVLSFLGRVLIPLARVERTMVIPLEPDRRENVAEHSFFLAGLACALAPEIDPDLDIGRVAQLAIAHDLVEAKAGDVSVWAPASELAGKRSREARALADIESEFGARFSWLGPTIREYEKLDTAESRFVYALDKIVPHAMVVLGDHHPIRPTRTDYEARVKIAREKIAEFPALVPYFDHLCEIFDSSPHYFRDEDDAVG